MAAALRAPVSQSTRRDGSSDIVIVGAGIGGLSAGALLAKYGYQVTVVESHTRIGGAAHGFERRTPVGRFHFDSGPSLFSGCSAPSLNPLRQVLDAVGEAPEWATYEEWRMYTDLGMMKVRSGDAKGFGLELERLQPGSMRDWESLQAANANLASLIAAVPPIALRPGPSGLVTAGPYLSRLEPRSMLSFGFEYAVDGVDPSGPFSRVLRKAKVPNTSLCYKWFDFLAFALSGLPVDQTSAASVSFMIREFFAPGAVMDQPIGGSQAVADALARAITKRGGEVLVKAHVDALIVEKERCVGARLADGSVRAANTALVSNVPAWNLKHMLKQYANDDPPMTPSFLHLHVGFHASATDGDWNSTVHHIIVSSWDKAVDDPDNLVFVSIPSVLDKKAAPPGFHVLHAYLPATEPYDAWADLDRKEYSDLKQVRAEVLWTAIERFIPDIRNRVVISMVGTPRTHERFLRRSKGTYGPAYVAGKRAFPGHTLPFVQGLFLCGDSTFPGIGVPAVAGSGIAVAHSIAPLSRHRDLLKDMRRSGKLGFAA